MSPTKSELKGNSDFTSHEGVQAVLEADREREWTDGFINAQINGKDTSVKTRATNAMSIYAALKSEVDYGSPSTKFLALRDRQGNTQALASYEEAKENKSIYVGFLVTAPWNITKDDPKTTKGSGTEAIISLIEKSRNLGYGGKITLVPLANAIPFYSKLGFKEVGIEMELTPENADKLLKNLGRI